MTINLNGAPIDAPLPAQASRAATTALSVAGINDSAAIARQQLPSAVPAPALIAAYAANVAAPPKPPLRSVASQPSSALAAQLIAQSTTLSEEDLVLFAPRPTNDNAKQAQTESDFISPQNVARGELRGPGLPTAGADVPTSPTKVAAAAREATSALQTSALATQAQAGYRTGLAQVAAGLPGLVAQFTRSLTLAKAHGVAAYSLAQTRNAAVKKPAVEQAAS